MCVCDLAIKVVYVRWPYICPLYSQRTYTAYIYTASGHIRPADIYDLNTIYMYVDMARNQFTCKALFVFTDITNVPGYK
jgi:hypothetical protein